MHKFRITGLLLFCTLFVSGCSIITKPPGKSGNTQAAANTPVISSRTPLASPTPTQTSNLMTIPTPTAAITATQSTLIGHCALLNSYDIASLFTQARTESMHPKQQDNHVSHPIFSTVQAPGEENSCIIYSFINPDVKNMQLLQITYWVDIPDPSASSSWTQAWTQLKSEGGKDVPVTGNATYFYNNRLTLQQRNIYITIEVTGQAVNAIPTTGSNPQLSVEKLVAQDILKNLKSGL
jgi:hypothetical protein